MKMLKTVNCTVGRKNVIEDRQNLIPRLKEAIKEKNDLIYRSERDIKDITEKVDGTFDKLIELETSSLGIIDSIDKRYVWIIQEKVKQRIRGPSKN